MAFRFGAVVCVLCIACGSSKGPTAPDPTPVPTPASTQTPGPIVQTLTGTLSEGDSVCSSPGSAHDNKPCRRYPFTTTTAGELDTILTWSGSADLDMEAWRGSTRFISSARIGDSTDRMRTPLEAGSYEVRVVYNSGTTLANYTLQMTHPQ